MSTTATTPASSRHEPELVGQTVVLIGGSAGASGSRPPDGRAVRAPM
jgi:hypothetical protein